MLQEIAIQKQRDEVIAIQKQRDEVPSSCIIFYKNLTNQMQDENQFTLMQRDVMNMNVRSQNNRKMEVCCKSGKTILKSANIVTATKVKQISNSYFFEETTHKHKHKHKQVELKAKNLSAIITANSKTLSAYKVTIRTNSK